MCQYQVQQDVTNILDNIFTFQEGTQHGLEEQDNRTATNNARLQRCTKLQKEIARDTKEMKEEVLKCKGEVRHKVPHVILGE